MIVQGEGQLDAQTGRGGRAKGSNNMQAAGSNNMEEVGGSDDECGALLRTPAPEPIGGAWPGVAHDLPKGFPATFPGRCRELPSRAPQIRVGCQGGGWAHGEEDTAAAGTIASGDLGSGAREVDGPRRRPPPWSFSPATVAPFLATVTGAPLPTHTHSRSRRTWPCRRPAPACSCPRHRSPWPGQTPRRTVRATAPSRTAALPLLCLLPLCAAAS